MTDKEMAVDWIRSQGWSEETLPSDEFGQMLEAFAAGFKTANKDMERMKCCQNCRHSVENFGEISCSLTEKNEYCSVAYNTENNDLWELRK